MLWFVVSALAASAQRCDAGYAVASRDWQGFSPDQRIKLQVLLTAVGFWDTVPNLDFGFRLYESVKTFQTANGLPSTGFVGRPEIDRLLSQAEPILAYWGFSLVQHPSRGHTIWVPVGLGLRAHQDEKGLVFEDLRQRLKLIYR